MFGTIAALVGGAIALLPGLLTLGEKLSSPVSNSANSNQPVKAPTNDITNSKDPFKIIPKVIASDQDNSVYGVKGQTDLINYHLNSSPVSANDIDSLNQEGVAARQWQEYMSNTAHQREVADLQAAGLNPVLSANGGANGYNASSGASSMEEAKLQAATSLKLAQIQANSAANVAGINAAATRYMSDNNVLASKYGTDMNFANQLIGGILGLAPRIRL